MNDEMKDGAILRTIVERILAVASPDRIIVFGSTARGLTTPDSDIDVLVLERAVRDPRQESIRLRSAIGDLGPPVDVIVMTTDRFDETRNVIGGIAHPAGKYGQVIYEAR